MPAATAEQLKEIETLVGPAAWAYHGRRVPEAERVKVRDTFAVWGDSRLVAADVLEAAALHAAVQATGSSGGLKRVKIEGEVEIEQFQATAATAVQAQEWQARAVRLRASVQQGARVVGSPLAGFKTGTVGPGVFRVTPPCREER